MTDPDRGESTSNRREPAVFSKAALDARPGEPMVVLIHGAMDRSASFVRATRLLDDLPIVRYDRRGYGHSTDLGVGDLDTHVADLLEVLDGRPGVLVGHSIGGLIALVAAERQPELVRSVAAWEAPMPWAPWWPKTSAGGVALAAAGPAAGAEVELDARPAPGGPTGAPASAADADALAPAVDGHAAGAAAEEAAERFMRKMIGDERWNRLPADTRGRRRSEGRALLADVGSLRGGSAPYDAAALSQPILAGCGTASVPYHRRAAEELAGSAQDGELMTVDGAAHGIHLSQPREFARFVRRAVGRSAE